MAGSTKSYLQLMRESKNKSREVVVAEMQTGTDTSTLYRYEQDPSKTPSDIMDIIINVLNDEYLGYLYLMDNPVARRFIPDGVKRMTKLQAVVTLKHAVKDFLAIVETMELLTVDDELDAETEVEQWLKCKSKFRDAQRAFISLECADGADK